MRNFTELKVLAEAIHGKGTTVEMLNRWAQFEAACKPDLILALIAESERLSADEQEATDLCDRLAGLLHGVALAVKGPEKPLSRHSFHDLPPYVKTVVDERDQLKAVNLDLNMGMHASDELIASLKAENAGLKTGHEAYEQLVQGLKAEIEALRKSSPSKEVIWCSCGDGHAANSYGAGFMDANGGVCANCDAANQGVEPDLDALRKDADRYRWLRSQHWNESDMAVVCHPKKSVKLGFDCPSGERLDHAIDAAMGKGELHD